MEEIKTVDSILSKVYPREDFDRVDNEKSKRGTISIKKIKMNGLDNVFVPASPVSLMLNHSKKIE